MLGSFTRLVRFGFWFSPWCYQRCSRVKPPGPRRQWQADRQARPRADGRGQSRGRRGHAPDRRRARAPARWTAPSAASAAPSATTTATSTTSARRAARPGSRRRRGSPASRPSTSTRSSRSTTRGRTARSPRRRRRRPARARRASTPTCRSATPAPPQFMAANPTWDGRGITIGILDSGVDLDHPAADHHHRRAQDRRLGHLRPIPSPTTTRPGSTWQDQVSGSSFTFKGVTYTAPAAGTYRFGLFNERDPRLGGEVGSDVNRDGNPAGSSGLFAVLWDTATNACRSTPTRTSTSPTTRR